MAFTQPHGFLPLPLFETTLCRLRGAPTETTIAEGLRPASRRSLSAIAMIGHKSVDDYVALASVAAEFRMTKGAVATSTIFAPAKLAGWETR
jgi:hypothetical protein